MLRKIGWDLSAGIDLTTTQCARFNEQVPDHPDVRYASITCTRPWHQMPAFAMHSHSVVSAAEGDNDGLVSAKSSVWGTNLGTWPVDHWQAVNRRFAIRHPSVDISPEYLKVLDRFLTEEFTAEDAENTERKGKEFLPQMNTDLHR